MMAMPMLSLRRKKAYAPSRQATYFPLSHAGTHHIKENSSNRQRNVALLFLVVVCLLLFLIPTPQEELDPEAAPPTPYTIRKSYLRTGSGWVLDNARVVASRIPKPFDSHSYPLSNSQPHGRQKFPEFQNKMYKLTAEDWQTYETKLVEFAHEAFPKRLAKWSVSQVKLRSPSRRYHSEVAHAKLPMQIWQTGKEIPNTRGSFQEKNPRASYNFFDDTLLLNWANSHFANSLVKRTWDSMERIVLKADFWRYLVVFLEGGFYSDTDTDCLQPIDVWGNVDAVTWDVGDAVSRDVTYGPPQVIVGIEVDVPDATGWETFWPRPIQIVQWTMAGAPGHPIFLDSIRRVVESMKAVKEWDLQRKKKAAELLSKLTKDEATLKDRIKYLNDNELWSQLRQLLTVDPFDKEHGGKMSLIEATGPGAFSDAVFSYLQVRYGIHWSQLHNIQTATRIGEVAILPITGFAPFWKPDWQRWKGIDKGAMAVVGDITHSQAMVNHHFSGSWRTEQDNTA